MGNACAAEREGKRGNGNEATDEDFLEMLEKGWQEGIGQAHGAIGDLIKDVESKTAALLGAEGQKPIQTKDQAKAKLFKYCNMGDLQKVKALIHFRKALVEVDAQDEEGCTALHIAAREGHLPVVKFLKDKCKAKFLQNNIHQYPRHCAKKNKHKDCVEFLKKFKEEEINDDYNSDADDDDLRDPDEKKQYKFHETKNYNDFQEVRVIALFEYPGLEDKPFADDDRPELRVVMDDQLIILEIRAEAKSALCRNKKSKKVGWVPYNVLSKDGKTPFMSDQENGFKH